MDLDTTAMHLGYTVMIGTAVSVGCAALAARYPREANMLLLSGAHAIFKWTAKATKKYEDNIKPALDNLCASLCANMGGGSDGVHAPRLIFTRAGRTVTAISTLESIAEAPVDEETYDMVLYRFTEENKTPVIRADTAAQLSDDFKCAEERFINVTLHVGDQSYTLNLKEPYDFFIVDNVILDKEFVSWWCISRLGFDTAPEDYKVTIIDGSADQLTLGPRDAVRLGATGYDTLEKNDGSPKPDGASDAEGGDADKPQVGEACAEGDTPEPTAWVSWFSRSKQ